MSPVAVSLPLPTIQKAVVSSYPEPSGLASTPSGPCLVIGSPSTAQDGRYQDVVLAAGKSDNVEKQMVDRILDKGELSFRSGLDPVASGGVTVFTLPLSLRFLQLRRSRRAIILPSMLSFPLMITRYSLDGQTHCCSCS